MIPKQSFGCTSHQSTRVIFGGYALGDVTQDEADRTLEMLIHYDINHIDTAPTYGDSELRIGPWMEKHRQRFFLATKTMKRSYKEARDEIAQSLERLRVDQVDLLQIHNLTDMNEWKVAMGREGVLKAVVEAREQGLTRFIGVTGHGTEVAKMHKMSIERFDFDSVMLPYNYPMMQNKKYADDFKSLITICEERNIAVQTIKSIALRAYGEEPRTSSTWYKPLEDQADIDMAVHWVLGKENVFLITGGDIRLLPKVMDAANRFSTAVSNEVMANFSSQKSMRPLFTKP